MSSPDGEEALELAVLAILVANQARGFSEERLEEAFARPMGRILSRLADGGLALSYRDRREAPAPVESGDLVWTCTRAGAAALARLKP